MIFDTDYVQMAVRCETCCHFSFFWGIKSIFRHKKYK